MKTNQKNILKGSLVAGALLTISGIQAESTNMFNYSDLGSGSELRQELLAKATSFDAERTFEMKCGEGKCGETEKKAEPEKAKGENTESKATEAKCGEGKCGEGETKKGEAAKKESKTEAKKEGKTTEAKCGEGKCGDK